MRLFWPRDISDRVWLWLILLSLGASSACAQRLLVETTSMSAMREAARVYVQQIDFGAEVGISPPEALPGVQRTGPALVFSSYGLEDNFCVTLPTGDRRDRDESASCPFWTFLSLYGSDSLTSPTVIESEPGWRLVPVCTAPRIDGTGLDIVVLSERFGSEGSLAGRVETYGMVPQTASPDEIPRVRWEFAGPPVAAALLPDNDHLAVLCHKEDRSGTVLRLLSLKTGPGHADVREVTDEGSAFGAHPGGMALSRDGSVLYILTTGYAANRPSGEPISWLHAVSTENLAPMGEPIELPGIPNQQDSPLRTAAGNASWVLTRSPGSEFAHATQIAVQEGSIVKKAQVPLTEVSGPFQIALSPSNDDVAVAINNRIELWEDGLRGARFEEFESAITTLAWNGGGLFAGGAGWLHRISAETLEITDTQVLQSGWVTEIVELPLSSADTLSKDDGSRSLIAHFRADLPYAIEFDAAGAGQEIKALTLRARNRTEVSWDVEYSRKDLPWLVIHPLSGTLPGVVYLGVDPGRCDTRALSQGTLMVRVSERDGERKVLSTLTPVRVRVVPEERSDTRRILWILADGTDGKDPSDSLQPNGLGEVFERLAAPPHYFVNREGTVPFQHSLDAFTVVVVTVSAMAKGALIRPDTLDYVVKGGGLLVVGAYDSTLPASDSGGWLAPLGVQFDPSVKVDGEFDSRKGVIPALPGFPGRTSIVPQEVLGWLEHNTPLPITSGCAVLVNPPQMALVPTGDRAGQTAFFVRRYGRGRIAVLASVTPMEKSPAFAMDLIAWLAGSGTELFNQDMDSDGLADETEDANGNGATDPGETDYLRADSDLDGLPDGVEDADLNGRNDDGETSPLNPDSDGDGVWDAADDVPLPASSSPVVSSVLPSEGPAEGGASVLVSGRNFAPDSVVWFGDRSSPTTRVLRPTELFAEIPPCLTARGGPADVRVVNTSTGLEGSLPGGFVYGPRSQVWFVARSEDVRLVDARHLTGMVSIICEPSRLGVVEQVAFFLKADTPEIHWKDMKGAVPVQLSSRVVIKELGGGQLLVMARRPSRRPSLKGVLAGIPWEAEVSESTESIRISIEGGRAFSRNDQPLDVHVRNETLNIRALRNRQPDAAPASGS